MDKELTWNLGPDQLADLLGITFDARSDEGDDDAADTGAELIEAQLVGTLALDTAVLNNLPTVIAQLDKDIFGGGGETLGRVLTDPSSDIKTIKKIKRYAKNAGSEKKSESERTVAGVIYYAAIANALLYHKVKIRTHSGRTLQNAFENLSVKPWMSKELAGLFAKALKAIEALPQ